MSKHTDIQDALEQVEEVKTCVTCTKMPEDGSVYCLHCRLYWTDVSNGLFNDIP